MPSSSVTGTLPVRRALLSVSDATGLNDFARGLVRHGVEILASGGTERRLREAGLPVTPVHEYTRYPEILDGRVKTLHPAIHGGILALAEDRAEGGALEELGLRPIDMVVCNFYPLPERPVPNRPSDELAACLDIGGPAMVRAAVKNHGQVAVVVDPARYQDLLEEMDSTSGCLSLPTRQDLALAALSCVNDYDAAFLTHLEESLSHRSLTPSGSDGEGESPVADEVLSPEWTLYKQLRYGENPHQRGWLYRDAHGPRTGLSWARQLAGKELSYNNYLDGESALQCTTGFSLPTVVLIKHNNPAGLASARSLAEAFELALASDPVSAFGSVMAVNRPFDKKTARALKKSKLFVEMILAPSFDEEALERLSSRKRLSLLEVAWPGWNPGGDTPPLERRVLSGGMLLQEADRVTETLDDLRQAGAVAPPGLTADELKFALHACRVVRSNAIVLARGTATVGVGAGQMSRVDSVGLALSKAGDRARGSILASDAFFPFPDGVELACEAGVALILQPGGSKNDAAVIDAVDRAGVSMLFTGRRHFRH